MFETFRTGWSEGVLGGQSFAMGQAPKEAERTVGTKFVRFFSERQWQEDLEEQRVGWSSLERKVTGAMENNLENCVHLKCGH